MERLLIIGKSDAAISAALRAREICPSVEPTIVVADNYPNFRVFVIPAISHEDIEQQRDRCIRDCHQDYPDDEETYWEQSSECVAKCQKTYWRNLHQQLNGTRTK